MLTGNKTGSFTRICNANGRASNGFKNRRSSKEDYALSLARLEGYGFFLSLFEGTERSIRKSILRNWTVWTHLSSRNAWSWSIAIQLCYVSRMRNYTRLMDQEKIIEGWMEYAASPIILAWLCDVRHRLVPFSSKFLEWGNVKFGWRGKSTSSSVFHQQTKALLWAIMKLTER